MRTVVKPLPHDLAVIAALQSTGKAVGYGAAPAGSIGTSGLPIADYLVVHRVGGQRDGTLNDPYADASLTYQINAVGKLPDGVAGLLGRVEAALLGATITDRVVTQVEPVAEQGPQADRDVGPPHPFWGFVQIRLVTVPA